MIDEGKKAYEYKRIRARQARKTAHGALERAFFNKECAVQADHWDRPEWWERRNHRWNNRESLDDDTGRCRRRKVLRFGQPIDRLMLTALAVFSTKKLGQMGEYFQRCRPYRADSSARREKRIKNPSQFRGVPFGMP
jgi:hypothetical protein